jgi:hypothetical protein
MFPLMTLRDDIFPPGPPRDGNIIRTQFVGTWESQLLGLGRLTAFLTERLLKESFAVDDMALYVIFLQRHRVEVGLKLVLERAGAAVPATHKLTNLLGNTKTAVIAAGMSAEWQQFAGTQGPYIRLVDGIDEGAATFRYPVNRNQQPWARDDYVDIAAFEQAGSAFQASLLDLVEDMALLEPLPIQAADAEAAARELRDLARACRRTTAVTDHIVTELHDQGSAILGRPIASAGAWTARRGYEAVSENAREIAVRADRMRSRIERAFAVKLEPEPADHPMPVVPKITPSLNPAAVAAQAQAVMQAVATAMIDYLPPLSAAITAVESRSAAWSTPYYVQLHVEVARLRSRLSNFT